MGYNYLYFYTHIHTYTHTHTHKVPMAAEAPSPFQVDLAQLISSPETFDCSKLCDMLLPIRGTHDMFGELRVSTAEEKVLLQSMHTAVWNALAVRMRDADAAVHCMTCLWYMDTVAEEIFLVDLVFEIIRLHFESSEVCRVCVHLLQNAPFSEAILRQVVAIVDRYMIRLDVMEGVMRFFFQVSENKEAALILLQFTETLLRILQTHIGNADVIGGMADVFTNLAETPEHRCALVGVIPTMMAAFVESLKNPFSCRDITVACAKFFVNMNKNQEIAAILRENTLAGSSVQGVVAGVLDGIKKEYGVMIRNDVAEWFEEDGLENESGEDSVDDLESCD